jgi:type IV pilus assembly protein PilO
MTNLQQGGSGLSGALLRRLWLGLPIAAGGSLALLLTALVLLPQWLALQGNMKRLSELEQLRNQLGLTRSQLNATATSIEKVQAQQAKLFEIVTGSGDLSTFMAMVDREAQLAGVQLDLFEPQTAAIAAVPGSGARPATAAPPAPPPQPGAPPVVAAAPGVTIPGLERQSILVSARGSLPALLDFLRRLEKLKVLVVPSDLRLQLEETKTAQGAVQGQTVVLKVVLSLYGRSTPPAAGRGAAPVSGAPAAAAGAQPPPASPAPAPPAPAPSR